MVKEILAANQSQLLCEFSGREVDVTDSNSDRLSKHTPRRWSNGRIRRLSLQRVDPDVHRQHLLDHLDAGTVFLLGQPLFELGFRQ